MRRMNGQELNRSLLISHYHDGVVRGRRRLEQPRQVKPAKKINRKAKKIPTLVKRQQQHWIAGHLMAIECNDWRTIESKYKAWTLAIPKSCGCDKSWAVLVGENSPEFLNRRDLARWFWARHNDVNSKLGKPELSWLECCECYRYPREWSETG
jgi:Erv1 / Alr family